MNDHSTLASSEQEAFARAMSILADLLDAAKAHQDDGQLSATFRGRGVEQNAFVRAFIERAQEDPAVLAAFISGLSGVFAAWAAGEQVTAEDLRQTTWVDVHGGPETVYWGEIDPKKRPPVSNADGAAERFSEEDAAAHAVADDFMAGKALFADMGAKVMQDTDTTWLEAAYREPGVEINTSAVDEALDVLQQKPALRRGFSVALTGLLHSLGEDIEPYSMDEIRQLTAAQCGQGTGEGTQPKEPPTASGGASEPPPENPVESAASSPAPSWRHEVADLVGQVESLMGAAASMDLDSSTNGAFARCALYDAQKILDQYAHELRAGKPNDYYGACIVRVQSAVTGARYMPDTAPGLDTILRVVCDLLEKAATICDNASIQPDAPSLEALETDPDASAWFMEGKALCADVTAEAIRIFSEGSDEAELEAGYRGRDVAQNNFVLPALRKVMERPELLAGFAAALSCTLSCAGTANENPDAIRALSYEDCVGGPNTKYISEEEDEEVISSADQSDEFIPANDKEAGFHTLLQRLDTYLEVLEHAGISEAAYDSLHKNVLHYYYGAREALNSRASDGTIFHRLRHLHEQLQRLGTLMGEDDPGFPTVQGCLRPLDTIFGRRPEDVELTPGRIESTRLAGAFVERMVGAFRDGHRQLKPQDWDALHGAASVVLSAVDDPVEDDASLRERLNAAIDSASVVFEDRTPEDWETSGIRQQDVGKRFVAAAH